MAFRLQRSAGGGVPDIDAKIGTGAGEVLAVRTPGDSVYRSRVREGVHRLGAAEIVNLQHGVIQSGNGQLSSGGVKSDLVGWRSSGERLAPRPGGEVIDVD